MPQSNTKPSPWLYIIMTLVSYKPGKTNANVDIMNRSTQLYHAGEVSTSEEIILLMEALYISAVNVHQIKAWSNHDHSVMS